MKRNRQRFLGKGISGYGRYINFKHNLPITQSNCIVERRLEAITFYNDFGLDATLCAFKISRRTLFRWGSEYCKSKQRTESLIPLTTKPHNTRRILVNYLSVCFIKDLREKYPKTFIKN